MCSARRPDAVRSRSWSTRVAEAPERGVLLWLTGPDEPDVLAALDEADGLQVVRRCADLAELLAAGAAGLGSAAVLALGRGVDRSRIGTLRAEGVVVVLVASTAEAARATALGADRVLVEADGLAQDVVTAVRAALEQESHAADDQRGAVTATDSRGSAAPEPPSPSTHPTEEGARRGAGLGHGTPPGRAPDDRVPHDRAPHDRAPEDGGPGDPLPGEPRPGRVVVVWSAFGSPGRSTLALNLAAEASALLHEGAPSSTDDLPLGGVALVDADTFAPSLAQAAALVEDSSAIAALCRASVQGVLDVATLQRRRAVLPEGVDLYGGLTRADRWRELGVEALDQVIETLRAHYALVVIDVAAGLETPGLRGVDRWQATRTALMRADDVLVLVAADPIGVRRAVHALGDLSEAGVTAARHVVVTKVRAAAAGRAPAEAVATALRRFADVEPAVNLPLSEAVDEAVLRGAPLVTVAPRSAVRIAIQRLAARVTGLPVPPRAGRRAARKVRRRRGGARRAQVGN